MTARLLWDSAVDGSVLKVQARPPAGSAVDAFDITGIGATVTIVVAENGRELAAITDGYHRIRLDVVRGSLLLGPVRLSYVLDDTRDLEAQLLAVRRLTALRRKGRFVKSLFPRERMAPRWIAALRASDATAAGTSQRDLAQYLFGGLAVRTQWRGESDFMRLRVQRLLRIGRRMIDRGYLSLLG
jgi:hypothetical protein